MSFLKSECDISRLCLRPPAEDDGHVDEEDDDRDDASFSADWTRLRSGERGESALLGRAICLTRGGEECSLTGKDCPMAELRRAWLVSGDGERWGEEL